MEYRVNIAVSIREINGMGGLEVRDEVVIKARSFLELSAVLARFHELAQKLAIEHGQKVGL